MPNTTDEAPRRPLGAPSGRRPHGLARERAIVSAATDLFAETGLDATTRDLALRLGITQPLLYRYFDSKEALVERVLAEALAAEWKPGWDRILGERTVPLRERLVAFYGDYLDEVLTYRRVRLAMFSGLKGLGEGGLGDLHARALGRVLEESRSAFSLPEAPGARDGERVRALHDSIVFLALRRHVLGWLPAEGMAEMVADRVEIFLEGAAPGMARADDSWAAETAGATLGGGGGAWVPAPRLENAGHGVAAGVLDALARGASEAATGRPHD